LPDSYHAVVTTDRALARAQVAERGLTAAAAEVVVRGALGGMSPAIVARATHQLRRLFSDGPWSAEDDAALSAAVGPGVGWYEEELDHDLTLGFGWRAGAFRAEARYTPAASTTAGTASPETADAPEARGPAGSARAEARTLGDTFEDAVVLELARTPVELYFRVGPGAGAHATFSRDDASADPRVAAAFRACPSLVQVSVGVGTLMLTIDDATHWSDELLALFDSIAAEFAPPRPAPADRQFERARAELGALESNNPRDLARILDATTSPDPTFRRIAIERLAAADSTVAMRPWTRGLQDSSRAVRRSTARVIARAALPETRDLLERALADTDACVRYYAVCGLFAIGGLGSQTALQQRRSDSDIRVRLAVEAALEDRPPP
jgi:hypothetical protein